MNKAFVRKLLAVSIFGTAATFIGHGALAALRDPTWVGLFKDSLATMGMSVSPTTAEMLTQAAGIADIMFGVLLVVMAWGLVAGGAMGRMMTSRITFYVLGVAVFWQLATATAYVVAGASLVPGVWNFLQASSAFVLPGLGIVLLRRLRRA